MAGWYIRRDEKVVGPTTSEKLKELVAAGRLLPTDELAKESTGPWTQAASTSLFVKPTPTASVARPLSPVGNGKATDQTVFEARKDFGTASLKPLIVLCVIFAIILNPFPLIVLLNPRPADKGRQNAEFTTFLIAAAAVDVGLVAAIWFYLRAKRRQRASRPVLRISNEGIQFGTELNTSIPWKHVAMLTEHIEYVHRAATKANLDVRLSNGRSIAIDIKRLDHAPEKIVAAAKEAFRGVRGVNVRQIKDFGEAVVCPRCGQPTDSLKCIQSGILIFLLLHVSFSLNTYICCRGCARRQLAVDSAINLISCNIAWPILWFGAVVIPQTGKLLLSGHDKKALDQAT